jgi:pimeloyl-ACP methyl ester carboxylesterase
VPSASIDGIATRYEVMGSGPPLLMFSPGGFDATLDNWTALGNYRRLNLLGHLTRRYTCIAFDRRESGRSAGRVERVTWNHYAAQGKGLLEHLDVKRAHLMGGCVGCSIATVFAVAYPETTASMVLYSPAGGARYRITQLARFARHLAYVDEHGLQQVVALANSHDRSFSQDPRVGPWVIAIRADHAFAKAYAQQDVDRYRYLVSGMARVLFDRDTVPGPEPEDLLRLAAPALVVPGQDASHATSAARYLQECLPRSEYWDVPVAEQTEQTAPARVLAFLDAVSATPSPSSPRAPSEE